MNDTDQLTRVAEQLARAGLNAVSDPSHRGRRHGGFVYPEVSGIASSFNPYAWNEYIDPGAGVVRLALGLPSRFDDRAPDNVTRLVPLGSPTRRPETGPEDVARYSQTKADVFDPESRTRETAYVSDLAPDIPPDLLEILTVEQRLDDAPDRPTLRLLTFDRLLNTTRFLDDLRRMLRIVSEDVGADVEIVFSCDLEPDGTAQFNLLSSRPLPQLPPRPHAPPVLQARGCVIGHTRTVEIGRLVYVSPAAYAALPMKDRYETARLIGRVNRASDPGRVLYAGPGRWCTTSPELGLPADFSEIDRAAAVLEIVAMRAGLTPELSRGAHLLNELAATGMLYFALLPGRDGNALDASLLEAAPDQLSRLDPAARSLRDVVRVVDFPAGKRLRLDADALGQNVLGFLE